MSNKEERMNRNKSIIEDYKNGKPILEIARDYNLSETMCYKILKGTQEPPRYFEKKRKRLTTRNEQIVKQYKGGMTARELGKMYGISMQRIYAILHSSGEYESQKYNHIETALKKEKKMRNQTFLDAYKKNPRKSIIELSREVNISPSLGYLILHQNGIYQYQALQCTNPLITVSSIHINEFEFLLKKNGFTLYKKYENYYKQGIVEYAFNGLLPEKQNDCRLSQNVV